MNSYLPESSGSRDGSADTIKIKWINDVNYLDKKVSGALCVCQNIASRNFLSIGIGVNVNFSPIPKISTSLKEITAASEEINVDDFVRRLAHNLISLFTEADKNGF